MDDNRVVAILSDYDGTLCPTACISSQDNTSGQIPADLEETLSQISSSIPVCIISSKDFYFLYKRTKKFSKIISCISGMETLSFGESSKDFVVTDQVDFQSEIFQKELGNNLYINSRHLLLDTETILGNSAALGKISRYFECNYPSLQIEKKFLTFAKDVLGGITIDWRNNIQQEWKSNSDPYRKIVKKGLDKVFSNFQTTQKSNEDFNCYFKKFFIQEYSSHPFIDIYGTHISKEYAYDYIVSELLNLRSDKGTIIYLGDSENDNPAFRKANISIGVNSDNRLHPSLDCKYNIKYDKLSEFLMRLMINDFNFSESLLHF